MKIELTDNQAALISRACEVCARLHMQQTDVLTDFAPLSYDEHRGIGIVMKNCKLQANDKSQDRRMNEERLNLFDIHMVLRHE